MSSEQDDHDFVYLTVDDALEIYAAIFGLTAAMAGSMHSDRRAINPAAPSRGDPARSATGGRRLGMA